MRQILYISLSTIPGDKADLAGILQQSRHNNALDGVSGLLWSDGACFMQAFEGPKASVATTYSRILADSRHRSIRVLIDRDIDVREFGAWTMAHRRAGEMPDMYDVQMRRLLADASPPVSAMFLKMLATGSPTG